jgi:rRNA-processing protein FCF1
MVVPILLDVNFLLLPAQFSVDIVGELERLFNGAVNGVVPRPVYEELKSLARTSDTKRGRHATLAVHLVDKRFDVLDVELQPDETVDDLLLRTALATGYPVATNDRALRKQLRDLNITTVYLRQRNRLDVSGVVR